MDILTVNQNQDQLFSMMSHVSVHICILAIQIRDYRLLVFTLMALAVSFKGRENQINRENYQPSPRHVQTFSPKDILLILKVKTIIKISRRFGHTGLHHWSIYGI